MSELLYRQQLFTRLLPFLLDFIHSYGYEVTLGDAYRDPRLFGLKGQSMGYGNKNSNHKSRLAIDLNLFKNGKFLSSTDDHRAIGEYWESLDPACRWGGRFNDGNHYEILPTGARDNGNT